MVSSFYTSFLYNQPYFTYTFYRAACNATQGMAVANSVRPSVSTVTKPNDALRIFSYHTKRQSL